MHARKRERTERNKLPSEQVIEKRGPGAADVEVAGRGRSEPDADLAVGGRGGGDGEASPGERDGD